MANRVLEMAIAIKGKLDGSLQNSVSGAVNQSKQLASQISAANKELKKLQTLQTKATGMNKLSATEAVFAKESEINQLLVKRSNLVDKINAKQEAQANFERARSNLGKAVAVTAVAAAPIALAVNEAIKFESVMADVKKTVDFDSPDGFKQMQKDIVAMSQRMPMAAEGIAQIVAAGGQAGIASKDLSKFAEGAIKMGIAFDITADQAGTMMAQWRTAFGMNQKQVETLADQINYLSNTSSASSQSISDVVTRIGPLASTAGVSAGQVAALGSAITGTGTPAEIAATGIKNMMLALTAGSSATKSQAEAFKLLGLDAGTMAQRMQVDAQGAILDVLKRLRELPEAARSSTLTQLFGKESVGAIAPLLTQLDGLQDAFNKVGDSSQYAGSMQAEYDARVGTTENQIQMAKNNLQALALSVGGALLPAVNNLLVAITPVITKMAEWAAENPDLVISIIAITGAIAGFVLTCMTINTVYQAFNSVKASIDLLTTSQTVLDAKNKLLATSQAALNAVMAVNPFVLIAVAVIALVGVLVYLWNTNEEFRNAVIATWEAVKSGVMTAIEAISGFLQGLWNAIVAGVQFCISILVAYVNFWLNLPQNIAYAIGFIIGILPRLPEMILNIVTMSGEYLSNLVTYIIKVGFDFLVALIEWLYNAWSTAIETISQMVNDIGTFLMSLPSKCVEAGAAFIQAAGEWGSGAYNAVMNWINQLPGAIVNAVSGIWENLKANVTNAFNEGQTNAKKFANGGIVTSPTYGLIGEAGYPEVVVPIDGTKNALSLWQKAGQMLGITTNAVNPMVGLESVPPAPVINPEKVTQQPQQSGDSYNPVFAPQITVYGSDESTIAKMTAVLEDKMREFDEMMERYRNKQRRLSYD